LRRHLPWPRSVFLFVSLVFALSYLYLTFVLRLFPFQIKGEDAGSHPAAALFDSKTEFNNGTVVKSLP
jgi:hypothetical protein